MKRLQRTLCSAEMKDPVKDKLKRFGLYLPLGDYAFFATVEVAVSTYVTAHIGGGDSPPSRPKATAHEPGLSMPSRSNLDVTD